jgi:hypothetical protein
METMEIGELTGYVADSRMQVAVLVPVDGAIILVNCTSGEKPEDFEKYVEPMLKTLKITKTSDLGSVTKLEKSDPVKTSNDENQNDTSETRTIDESAVKAVALARKGLKPVEYLENDRLFVRLPMKYFVMSKNSENTVISYMSLNPDDVSEIIIQFRDSTDADIEKLASSESGTGKVEQITLGSTRYWSYKMTQAEKKQIFKLFGKTPSGMVQITVNGRLGLEGDNGKLLKSIIYK